jgi:hypothetical protein
MTFAQPHNNSSHQHTPCPEGYKTLQLAAEGAVDVPFYSFQQ